MNVAKLTIDEGAIKSALAWGSVAYAFGFITVMLHTARLGFPVLELLGGVYIWIGAPIAIVCFFSLRIVAFFQQRATRLAAETRASWVDLTGATAPADNVDLISRFAGEMRSITPFFGLVRGPIETVLVHALKDQSESSRRLLSRLVAFIRGFNAIFGFFQLLLTIIYLLGAVYAYVWLIYPVIPQNIGGGAPALVRLVVVVEKIPQGLSSLPRLSASAQGVAGKTEITRIVKLLYATKECVYIEESDGTRLSLRNDAIGGIIWNPG